MARGNPSTCRATADPNFHVVSISGCGGTAYSNTANEVTTYDYVTGAITGHCTVTASFAINQYTLTYTAGTNGSISGTSPQTVNYGGSGTAVTAVAHTGYHFVQWSDNSTDNPRTDTNVTGNITVTASFAINQYTLTYTAGTNGSISGTSPQTVNHGGSGTAVTAAADMGYHFVKWSDNSTDNPRTDANVTGNITVTASFAINQYTLTYTAGAGGSIRGTSPQTVNHGGSGTEVTAVPNTGYHFVQWSDGVLTDSRTDGNLTANLTVTAIFAINQYTVTATAGDGGSLDAATPSPQTLNHGVVASFTFNADEGYHVAGISGCGGTPYTNSSNAVSSHTYLTGPLAADCGVTATFEVNRYILFIPFFNAGPDAPVILVE